VKKARGGGGVRKDETEVLRQLPTRLDPSRLLVHCLDTEAPVKLTELCHVITMVRRTVDNSELTSDTLQVNRMFVSGKITDVQRCSEYMDRLMD
jgi:hypothetical protein